MAATMTTDNIVYRSGSAFGITEECWGPFCIEHRSRVCEHALGAIRNDPNSADLMWQHIRETCERNVIGSMTLVLPIWPELGVWIPVVYEYSVYDGQVLVNSLTNPANKDLPVEARMAVDNLVEGDSINGIALALTDYFRDRMIVEQWTNPMTWTQSCAKPIHSLPAQRDVEATKRSNDKLRIAVMGVLLHECKMCLTCYKASTVGAAVTRVVTGDASLPSEDTAANFDDLIPGDDDTTKKRSR